MKETTSNAVVKITNLTHVYADGTKALDSVNLELYDGEFVGIIGQNGSGKTTLVKHLNGLLKPTNGEVFVNAADTRTRTIAELAREVGYVFQNPDHQICQSTTFDEVAFGPRNLGLSDGEVRELVKTALRDVRIEKLAQRHPLLVSKGERQRIAIASVLAMRPKIIVVDEPTTGQDYLESKEIMDLLRRLNEEGRTVLVISHNMKLVAEYAARVIVFAEGRILLDGRPSEVFAQEELLKKTLIRPPQITRLMRMLVDYGVRPDTLHVDEAYKQIAELSR
jgi:energy-coupling factor transport system ATP-binding protein